MYCFTQLKRIDAELLIAWVLIAITSLVYIDLSAASRNDADSFCGNRFCVCRVAIILDLDQ